MDTLFSEKSLINHPASILISGMSMSGKTFFVQKLVENINKIFSPVPTEIFFS